MTSICILAGIRLYRESLARLLTGRAGLEVAGTHPVDAEAASYIQTIHPSVVLLDMCAPAAHAVAHSLQETQPDLSVVALGVPNSEIERLRCAEVGIIACVTEDAPISELLSVIDRAARGEAVCSPTMTRDLVRKLAALSRGRQAEPLHPPLTRREREIAVLLAQDLSNKEIASRLGIEVATVKNHVHNVLDKMSVRRRSEIATAVTSRAPSFSLADTLPTRRDRVARG